MTPMWNIYNLKEENQQRKFKEKIWKPIKNVPAEENVTNQTIRKKMD